MIDLPLERTFFTAGALKALGEGRIGGYLAVWGSPAKRDLQGEYFTPETDFALDWYPTRPVLFHHGLDENVKAEDVGIITTITPDEQGLYAEATINLDNPFGLRVYRMCEQGKLGWSSGSAPNLVEITEDGQIKRWPIVEGSLTPSPAEPRRTTVQALKSAIAALESAEPPTPEEPTAKEGQGIMAHMSALLKLLPMNMNTKRGKSMDLQKMLSALEGSTFSPDQQLEIVKLVATAYAEGAPESDAMMAEGEEPIDEQTDAIAMTDEDPYKADGENPEDPAAKGDKGKPAVDTKAVAQQIINAMKAEQHRRKTAPSNRVIPGFSGADPRKPAAQITVKSKYSDLSAQEMSYYAVIMGARGRKQDIKFYREMSDKAVKAFNDGKMEVDHGYGQLLSIKANENNSTEVAADGQDWVPTLWSSDLWMRVRINNNVASNIETFAMPSQSYVYPIESTDPVVYAVDEASDTAENEVNSNVFTKSKVTTDNLTFTAKKLGLQVVFTTEIEEDSIIPFIPRLREQALRAMSDAVDNVILNADATTGTGNINYKGANTSAAPKSKFLYGGGDGMRHLALVDNTAVSQSGGGAAPTLQMLRQLRFKMLNSLNAYGIDPSLLVMFVDPQTYGTFLNIDEIAVYLNNGRGATVNDGLVPNIDGSPVYASKELALTDSTGYAMADGSGTLGQVVIANRNAWKLGYRRQVTSDVSYIPYNDQYILTITARMALKNRDTISAAYLYNLAV